MMTAEHTSGTTARQENGSHPPFFLPSKPNPEAFSVIVHRCFGRISWEKHIFDRTTKTELALAPGRGLTGRGGVVSYMLKRI